ncbi:MAG: sugar phosphate isomerase/epimerase, partial [Victivallales bacterium]|nr:sugar phosphate isomerase/epimerase [Victivallales bacterium]
ENELRASGEWGVRELVAPQYFYRPGRPYIAEFQKRAERYGMKITGAHGLLGPDYDLGCTDDTVLAEHVRFLEELSEVGIRTYTVHTGSHHAFFGGGKRVPSDFWPRLRHALDVLLPVAEKTGITLAVENIYEPFNILDLTVSLVESYNHPLLGLCFDSGHANVSPAGLSAVFDRMKDNIVTCHLHDNDGNKDTHSAPGHGSIDWPALMAKLLNLPRLIHLETESREYSQSIWHTYESLLRM